MVENTLSEVITFNAVRQLVVMPDRRYRMTLRNNCLYFQKTGSQYDRNCLKQSIDHIGDIKWIPPWALSKFKRLGDASKWTVVATGGGLVAVSILPMAAFIKVVSDATGLLAVKFTHQLFIALPFLFIFLIIGLVLVFYGSLLDDPPEGSGAADRHDLRMPLPGIKQALLVKGQGGPAAQYRHGGTGQQVAMLRLQPVLGKLIKLAIPTDEDLEIVEEQVMPRLRNRAIRR
ncbi:MAG: hypothetical protein ACMUJM_23055 [bacterium]